MTLTTSRRLVLVVERARLRQQPALLAGGLRDPAHERRLGDAAGRRLQARKAPRAEAPPVLVEQDVAVEDLGERRGHELLRRRRAEEGGGGLVGEDERAVGPLHRDRLAEVLEHRLQAPLGPPELGEEPGVVERERGPAGRLAGELEVVLVVGVLAGEAQEREHAERATPRDERDDDGGRVAHAQHQPQVLLGAREALQVARRQLGQEPGLAAARGLGDGVIGVPEQRELLADRPQGLGRAGIGGEDGGSAHGAVVGDEIDDAHLGHVGDGEPDDLVEHRARLGGRLEQPARAVQEVGAHARAALDREDRGGRPRRALEPPPGRRAGHGERPAGRDDGGLDEVVGAAGVLVGHAEQGARGDGEGGDERRRARGGSERGDERADDEQRPQHGAPGERRVEQRNGGDERHARAGRGGLPVPSPEPHLRAILVRPVGLRPGSGGRRAPLQEPARVAGDAVELEIAAAHEVGPGR